MKAQRFLVGIVLVLFGCWCPALVAQEAIDLEKANKQSETTTSETKAKNADAELTPTPIPAKPAKRTPAEESSSGTSAEKPRKSVSEVMRPEEFKAAGLDKLDEDELQHLDAWLQGYRHTTEKKAAQQAETKASEEIKKVKEEAAAAPPSAPLTPRTQLDSLVSRVDGTFAGLKGKTLIRLEDGTVWKQADRDAIVRSVPIDHPAAVVLHTTFGYKMRIEGVGNDFYVDPVR